MTADRCPNCGADSWEFKRVPMPPKHPATYVCLRCEIAVEVKFLPSAKFEELYAKIEATGV